MPRIMSTGKQYVVTVPKELVEMMRWRKGTEILISKYPEKDILFMEEVKKNA